MENALIEQNKDKLNLVPNIAFVTRNISYYNKGLENILNQPVQKEAQEFTAKIAFEDVDCLIHPTITPDEIRQLVSVLPESIIRPSKLKTVRYLPLVPVPRYNADGEFTRDVEWVDYDQFPRSGDHPTRLPAGLSNGTGIYMTPIPKTVSTDEHAVRHYQYHVFLHELLHTLDYPRKTPESRAALVFEVAGKPYTFQDFREDFEKLYLAGSRKPVSMYAATYGSKLNQETKTKQPDEFASALAEQICESFVGYMLGIISNPAECLSFKEGHPQEHSLIDKLYTAKVVRCD